MTVTDDRAAVEFRQSIDMDTELERLLESAAVLSYDPDQEIDWDKPLDPTKYGLNPEWSTLYGTALWDRMSEQQRIDLTRHEVGSIMSTGIWFETMLQSMVLRSQYSADYGDPEFRFALTEIADECRHSLMFSKTCSKMGVPHYRPRRLFHELARVFRTTANGEMSYAAILVAEEVLDVMQRDWMRGENVLEEVRTSSKIHVVEEARHMKFARMEIREHLAGISKPRRHVAALAISIVAAIIVDSLVNDAVYANVGLDPEEAKAAVNGNTHHQNLMRMSCVHLMDFLSEVGLLTPSAMRIYRTVHML
ncbi:AurF N-oxygenase family protein [Aeromicrobium duanguangcaii]|uniref:Diiron oxygenase n=1 Tax=Aeromicrobium duanguangcaii TaxID=2968086 RepID=A0ABY5KHZ5_9ACTN|nr:diiron oxygenase [Aeromicrobium duanguangcaii]MCD9153833.1 diiron oxygenase [Aeromicrobium duanguangcaii]UUI69086.1 diiron oxygenase [Aeromicrobium duanguangcaii]